MIAKILKNNGYQIVEGTDIFASIGEFEKDRSKWLCSGYRVFPDGSTCPGCTDCRQEVQE